MTKQPDASDFEARFRGGGIEVHFKPTNSYFAFHRLADTADIERLGPVSTAPIVRHAQSGGLGDYSPHADKVYALAWAAAVRYVESESKILANASRPATLVNGGVGTYCYTLKEAVLAWRRLPEDEREAATIRADDGTVYEAEKIRRLYIS